MHKPLRLASIFVTLGLAAACSSSSTSTNTSTGTSSTAGGGSSSASSGSSGTSGASSATTSSTQSGSPDGGSSAEAGASDGGSGTDGSGSTSGDAGTGGDGGSSASSESSSGGGSSGSSGSSSSGGSSGSGSGSSSSSSTNASTNLTYGESRAADGWTIAVPNTKKADQTNLGGSGVSGIWFKTTSEGLLSVGDPSGMGYGDVFSMTGATTVVTTSPPFSGSSNAYTTATGTDVDPLGLQVINGYGISVLTADAVLVYSLAATPSTFSVVPTKLADNSNESVIWASPTVTNPASGWTIIVKDYASTTSVTNPSSFTAAGWTTDPWPGSLNVKMGAGFAACQNDLSDSTFYRSTNGQTILVGSEDNDQTSATAPGLCVSTTGGTPTSTAWTEFSFPGAPSAELDGPNVLTFADDNHGLVIATNNITGVPLYAAFTTTGGASKAAWTASTLPALPSAFATPEEVTLNAAWYSAGSTSDVWIAGNYAPGNGKAQQPLLYFSSDGGAKFCDVSAALYSAMQAAWPGTLPNAGVESVTPFAGFALDTTDVWVGGQVQYFDKTSGSAVVLPFLAYSTTAGSTACP